MNERLVVGIFVGGQGSRMGGVAKGLLRAPGSELSLVERLAAEALAASPNAEIVLVGAATAYARLPWPAIADEPTGIGPLGGLIGLLAHAVGAQSSRVLALACDLPRLDREVIARLLVEQTELSVLAAEHEGVRNPLIARYDSAAALVAARNVLATGKRSLQAVLDALAPRVGTLQASASTLDDWDTLTEVRRG